MTKPIPDFLEILKILAKHKIDFIVVGGVCAVLHGAPVSTFDLDVVHSRSPDNLEHLISALGELDAYYRGRGEQRLRPNLSYLSTAGHHLLMTRFGPLDLLGTIGAAYGYDDLLEHTVEILVSDLKLRLLSLERLIEVKEETAQDKDKAALPILRRTLEEKLKR